MNAEGIRRCMEEKEAAAAERNELAAHTARLEKECGLYERDLEHAMESCDELARESDDLRKRLRDTPDVVDFLTIFVSMVAQLTERGHNMYAPISGPLHAGAETLVRKEALCQQFHQAEAQVVELEGHEPGRIEAAVVPLAAKLPRLQGAQEVNLAGRSEVN
uniref:Uncharacterized protein n=1 Tax=Aegilops tauschii TaxID=37682 RepID=M8BSL6_AEGTA